jgi:hypothetical protein
MTSCLFRIARSCSCYRQAKRLTQIGKDLPSVGKFFSSRQEIKLKSLRISAYVTCAFRAVRLVFGVTAQESCVDFERGVSALAARGDLGLGSARSGVGRRSRVKRNDCSAKCESASLLQLGTMRARQRASASSARALRPLCPLRRQVGMLVEAIDALPILTTPSRRDS